LRYEFARDNLLNKKHGLWLQRQLGFTRPFENFVTLGVYDGDLIAVVLYHDWNPDAETICMSSAATSKKWLTGETLYRMHAYCFDFCQLAVLQVSENNENMLGIADRFGYDLHKIPRLRGRNEAEMICTLTKEAWQAQPLTRRHLRRMNK
jgi:RimJ/RimL family protein N-acetyltransferase